MIRLLIIGFGLSFLISGRCPISKTIALKGTGARLAGIAVIAAALNVWGFIALPVSGLGGGMETAAGVLMFTATHLVITGLIVFGLFKYFGGGAASPA